MDPGCSTSEHREDLPNTRTNITEKEHQQKMEIL